MDRSTSTEQKVQRIVDSAVRGRHVFGSAVTVRAKGRDYSFCSGDLQVGDRFFIASITKLFTTAAIFQLIDEGKLNMASNLGQLFDTKTVKGLHVVDGMDHSFDITIEQLLSHTSGLADYFMQKREGDTLYEEITKNKDVEWSFQDTITWTKSMSPKFIPGEKGRAFYSDTNYQLLGKLIEQIEGQPIARVFEQRIFEELGMNDTYLYEGVVDEKLKRMYFKNKTLDIPKAMQSFGSDGGAVSTSQDLAIFITAFFAGKLFSKVHIEGAKKYNKLFFPLEYGVGIMRFKLPRAFNLFRQTPELIGHSGHSGSFAFYNPETKTTICGTVNQIDKPSLSYKMLTQIAGRIVPRA